VKSRRGLSTVIGAIFFIIAASSTIGYVTYSMNTIDKYNQSVLEKNQEDVERSDEQFKITRITIDNNKLNMTIQNIGTLPINITRLWVENTTDTDDTDRVFKYDVKQAVYPGENIIKVGQNIPLTIKTTQAYDLKLVTERGNEQKISVNSANTAPLHLQIFALPEEVPTGFTTTLLFAVTNNMSDNSVLTNLTPNIVASPSSGASAIPKSSIIPASYQVLNPGDTAYFKQTYTLTGESGESVGFTASLQNGYSGQSVSQTVDISIIEQAEQSQTSLTSAGLGSQSLPDDLLVLHKETTDALDGRQLYGIDPESSSDTGTIIQLDSTDAVFYTNYDSPLEVTIPQGKWNATLRYLSQPMPDSLASLVPGESGRDGVIYHFEDGACGTPPCYVKDSSGDSPTNLSVPSTASNRPTWSSNIGPHSSGAFSFDGGDYLDATVTDDTKMEERDITTAGWFRTSVGTGVQVIFRAGDDGDTGSSGEFYQISLNGQNLRFNYRSDNNSGDNLVTCQTSGFNYANNNWQHFVAIRDDHRTCKLYINGTLVANDNSNGGGGNTNIDVSGDKFAIGRDPSCAGGGSCNYFTGDLDDIIHWDDDELATTPSNQIDDLYKTNFGVASHKVTFTIERVTSTGLPITGGTVIDSPSYQLNFADGFGDYDLTTPPDSKWKQFNFTGITTSDTLVDDNERLKFKMHFENPADSGEKMKMKLKIDDQGIVSGQLKSSLIQMPFPDKALTGYATYDNSGVGHMNVHNTGTNGAWISFMSRMIFDSMDDSSSYGALIKQVEGRPIDSTKDSAFFAPGDTNDAEFDKPYSVPGDASTTLVPEGRYKMYAFLSGYDERGQIFLQTAYVGVVRVT